MAQDTETIYICRADGWYKRPAEQRLTNADAIIAQIGNAAPRTLKKAITTTDPEGARRDWNLALRPTNATLVTRLSRLRLTTNFSLRGNNLIPTFADADGAISAAPDWTPPDNMQLYFAFVAVAAESLQFRTENPYLFATGSAPTPPGAWQLPLPNHYDDGRLCLGRTLEQIRGNSLNDLADKLYAHLQASIWNTELWRDNERDIGAMFSFDVNLKQLPTPPDWHRHCRRFSTAHLEGAPL